MVAQRVMGWLGWAGLDAVCRIGFLLGSTAIFSRFIAPEDFGAVAVVLITMTLGAACAGLPFEQPLAQHGNLRRAHVETAFTTSMAISALLFVLSFPIGAFVAEAYDAPVLQDLMPAAAISIFFLAHTAILRGLARRQRRFAEIAIASLVGHAGGIILALIMLFLGFGVWALLAQRVLVTVVEALAITVLNGVSIRLRFSLPFLKDLWRYAGLQAADRFVESINFFVFNYLVAGLYGLTVLGYVNMAMRTVEPLRGVVLATAHNLTFYYFAAAARSAKAARLGPDVLWRSALVIAPVFFGLAAVLPVLLPVLVGPGWEDAIGIGVFLCIGSAIFLPARLVFTELAADAKPEFGVAANIVGALTTVIVLVVAAGVSPLVVGIARAAGDAAQAVMAIALPHRIVGWPSKERFWALGLGWALAAAMAIVVTAFMAAVADLNVFVLLVLSITLGVAVYAAILSVWAKPLMREVVDGLKSRRQA